MNLDTAAPLHAIGDPFEWEIGFLGPIALLLPDGLHEYIQSKYFRMEFNIKSDIKHVI